MAAAPPPSCRRIDATWTVSTLVASYLDLALAYLFLCASTLAYVADTSLSIFGLSLPCPCSLSAACLFRRGPGCLHGFLVDYPLAKVAGVHSSVRRRFPFDADCGGDGGSSICCGFSAWDDLELVKHRPDGDEVDDDGGGGRALLETGEGAESSRGSVSKPWFSKSLSPVQGGDIDEEEKGDSYDQFGVGVELKGKGVPLRRSPSKLARRRRAKRSISKDIEISPTGSPPTPLQVSQNGEEEPVCINPSGGIWLQSGVEDKSSVTLFGQNIQGGGSVLGSGSMLVDKGLSDNVELLSGSGISEASVISDFKQAFEEEKRAHAALSLELENERNSASTAVNDVMTMLYRVQEEKASIEMEARQYKRMIEEKSAYDEEEMDILKEIIIRREREKHMLEKEVEAYRRMMLGDSDVEQPLFDEIFDGLELVEEKDVSLHSIGRELTLNEVYKSVNHLRSIKDDLHHHDDCGPSSDKEQKYATNSGEGSYGTEDALFTSLSIGSTLRQLIKLQEKGFHESTLSFSGEGKNVLVPSDNLNSSYDVADKISTPTLSLLENDSISDVHVVVDKPELGEVSNLVGPTPIRCASNISLTSGSRNEASVAESVENTNKQSDALCKKQSPSIQRSSSDIALARSPSSSSQRASWLNLRRTSMPYIDSERFKLENEVDLLRERLKLIRQGRERIGFSAEPRDKEGRHLRLLEEISCQLQGIRKATEPGKSIPHIPLPPSSQAKIKKKRCRSVSVGPNDSN